MYKSIVAFNTGKEYKGFLENLSEEESISTCHDCEILNFSTKYERQYHIGVETVFVFDTEEAELNYINDIGNLLLKWLSSKNINIDKRKEFKIDFDKIYNIEIKEKEFADVFFEFERKKSKFSTIEEGCYAVKYIIDAYTTHRNNATPTEKEKRARLLQSYKGSL